MHVRSFFASAALVAVALGFPAPVQAAPLDGRFVASDGAALEVRAQDDGGYRVRFGEREGRATRAGDRLVVRWGGPRRAAGMVGVLGGDDDAAGAPRAAASPDALAIVSAEGRLALAGAGRRFLREEDAPWWRLPEHVRGALVGPLQGLEGEGGFDAFFAERYAGTPVDRRAARAEWAFGGLDEGERISLLCHQAKMARDGVWQVVGPLAHVSRQGAIHFEPTIDQAALQELLKARAFGDWWWASRGAPWGMRSRFRGVQLHWRGGTPTTQVHIDFLNPGDPLDGRVTGALEELVPDGLDHFATDFLGWHLNHEPGRLLREVRGAGIEVFIP